NVRTSLKAKLLLPGPADVDVDDFVRIGLDSAPPAVDATQLLTGTNKVAASQRAGIYQVPREMPLFLRVSARDMSGIRALEYEFADPNLGQNALKTPKTYQPQIRKLSGDQYVFDVPLATKDLPLNRYRLLLRLYDSTGHESLIPPIDLEFVTPPPMPTKGIISGTIRFKRNNAPVSGGNFTVTVTGPDGRVRAVEANRDGTFRLADLPPGKYSVTAQGTPTGTIYVGEQPDVQPSPPSRITPVNILVDRPPRNP
ncbi:MAG: carboxypeptidase-like regulatory domain-containing protein, partial [Planctomycetes bacterium]|nr:carboxypeptidase-like regulatory domain-containing protein [Planctomycetota bacterium]